MHSLKQLADRRVARARDHFLVGLDANIPVPRIRERLDLRRGGRSGLILEDRVVVAIRVERRVEVDEVDPLLGELP